MKKNVFLEKLARYLSFYFDDMEVTSIINDYDEWFENESLQGKSEEEISLALQSPREVFYNLIFENCEKKMQVMQLFSSMTMRVIIGIILFYCMNCLLLKICNNNMFNYLYFALCIIFFSYIGDVVIIKKDNLRLNVNKKKFYIENISASVLAIIVILSEKFLLPQIDYVHTGKIYTFILSILSLFFFLVSIFIVVKKMFQNRAIVLFTILHFFGVVSLLFFGINQSHMLYDTSDYTALVCGSMDIYIVTVILCFVFYIQKIYTKK